MVVWCLGLGGAGGAFATETAEGSDEAADPEGTHEQWPVQFPGQCTPDDANFDLEVLYYEHKFDEGLKIVRQRLAAPSPTPDLYWMKARFMYEVGERFERDDPNIDKVAWYQEMLAAAQAGLKLAPNDRHLLFARGVAMGRLGTTRGVLSSLFMADDIESDWLTVANDKGYAYASLGGHEIIPCDTYHALGIFYRLVPDWWIVQMLSGTRGDLEKSLQWHQKAVQCKPNEVSNWKELGATQLCIGQKKKDPAMVDAGIASLRRGAGMVPKNDRQRIDVRHCKAMMEDPSMACEYSRDGQQDLDQKKLEAQKK